MPNLQPDTSIYANIGKNQGGFGGLSLSDIVSLAGKMREMQTQNAVSEAIKKNPDDMGAAWKGVIQDPNAYPTPGMSADFSHARGAALDVNSKLVQIAQDGLTSLIGKGSSITAQDVIDLVPRLSAYDPAIGAVLGKLVTKFPTGGQPLLDAIGQIYNQRGQAIPTTNVYDEKSRKLVPVPTAQANVRLLQGAPPGGPPGAAGAGPPPAGPLGPGMSGGLPVAAPGAVGAGEEAAKVGTALRLSSPQISQQRALLSNLDEISKTATTGDTSGLEQAVNATIKRWLPNTTLSLTPKELADTEAYAKFAQRLAGEMPGAQQGLNVAWANAIGSNPNLHLSRLGREGITHWLQGNTDAQALLQSQWDKWLSANPGQESQFSDWLNRPHSQGGFGMTTFDPRVFQFARLNKKDTPTDDKGGTVNEAREFLQAMPPAELKRFEKRVNEYKARGWLKKDGTPNIGPGEGEE